MSSMLYTVRGLLPVVTTGSLMPLPAAAIPFTPLLDVYSNAVVSYSFRLMRTGYAGSAVRIRRSSDNVELDIGFTANGDFDVSAAASHIGGSTGFIVKMYDQSGNGWDVSQATAANQPTYVASGIGGHACMNFVTSSTTYLLTGTNAATHGSTNGVTTFGVAYLTSSASAYGRLFSMVGTGQTDDHSNGTSISAISRNSTSASVRSEGSSLATPGNSITYGTAYNFGSIFRPSPGSLAANSYLNGVADGGLNINSPTGGPTVCTFGVGRDAVGSAVSYWDGQASEVTYWKTDRSSDVSGIHSNLKSYYGL